MHKKILFTIFLLALQAQSLYGELSQKSRSKNETLLRSEKIMREELIRHERWKTSSSTERQPSPLQQGFDVLHYELDLDIDPALETVSGTVTVECSVTTNPLTLLALDLFDNMTVTETRVNGTPVAFTHEFNLITIDAGGSFPPGETLLLAVDYAGQPISGGRFGGFQFSTHGDNSAVAVYSISAPDYARSWWPCKDVLDDKATADIWITVPDTLIVASNGRLIDTADAGAGKRRFEWRELYPISTYLISVAISDYLVYSEYYHHTPMDSMEVVYFVYPEDSLEAKEDFNVTVSMIDFYSSIFGPYPFLAEKYGMAEASWGSLGMEHQTCTTYGEGFIRGNHQFDLKVAHELAHQWWGDFVTIGDWRDIWLNEGFATYAEALWEEQTGGFQAYKLFMSIINRESGFPGSIYDPDDLFNTTVYWKGAWTLHMLRHVMGDSVFFQVLDDYGSAHAYTNAVTTNFQQVCETVHGEDLSWFFDQWVYGTCRPYYQYSWTQYAIGSEHFVRLEVKQIQQGTGAFAMPIDIRFHGAGWDSTVVVSTSSREDIFTLGMPGPVDSLELDPDDWILKWIEIGRSDSDLGRIPSFYLTNYPNPFNLSSETRIALHMPAAGNAEVAVFDVKGERVRTIHAGRLGKGLCEFVWDGMNDQGNSLSSGVYFIRLSAPQGTLSRKALLVK